MRAVVLVGGFGTRLRPLTFTVPKQMLPVGRATMLERVVTHLGRHGVDEVVLSLGYRPDVFVDAFPDGTCAGVALRYAVEPQPLDTGGAIAFAAREAGVDETFLALNGDVLTDLDLGALVAQHRARHAVGTIALTPVDDPSRYGVVATEADGRVTAFVEKPAPGTAPSRDINAGAYVLEPEVLDLLPPGQPTSIEREVFPRLAESGRLYALTSTAYWIDAGTPVAYLDATLAYLDGSRGRPEPGIDATATIDPGATVSRSAVGPGARIEAGAEVVDSIVMAGATVGTDARLERSIVGGGAHVGARARLSRAVVGFDRHVAAGTELVDGTDPPPEEWS